MTPNDLKIYQFRFNVPDLSLKQATLIQQFEEFKETHSNKHFLSTWDEWDYELTTLRQILRPKQLTAYEKQHSERVVNYERTLIKEDQQNTNEISYYEELLTYYEEKLLPPIYDDIFLSSMIQLHTDKTKISFLRSEYKAFLNDTKAEILSSHFRHNRAFKPHRLKSLLLQHRISYLFPDYSGFEYSMDEPTKAVATYLKTTITSFTEPTEKLIRKQLDQLKKFVEKTYKKYHETPTKGWHITILGPTAEEMRKQLIMTMLLLDRHKYGC